jgi:hypothetical protein
VVAPVPQAVHDPLDKKYPEVQVKATVADEQVAAFNPHALQPPDYKKNPVLQVVAIIAEVQAEAPAPHGKQAPLDTKYPESQVKAIVPEQVAAFDPQAIHAPFYNENPVKQVVTEKVDEHEEAPPGLNLIIFILKIDLKL